MRYNVNVVVNPLKYCFRLIKSVCKDKSVRVRTDLKNVK